MIKSENISLADRGATLLATGFGSGYSPVAPGTAGSVAALVVWGCAMSVPALRWAPVQWIAWSALTLIGVWSTRRHLLRRPDLPGKPGDPGEIVVDEWSGMWVALLLAGPPTLVWWGLAFALFRVLDALKPWPIRVLERMHGAWGVMLDDVAAGIVSGAIVYALKLA